MNRFNNIFLVAVFCSTYVFSQSTNFVGTGTENVGFSNLQFSGSGDYPTNYAANVENVVSLDISNSSIFNGGAGGFVTNLGIAIVESSGSGLRLTDVGLASIVDGEFFGGMGGTVVASNEVNTSFPAESRAGHGIELNGDSSLNLGSGVDVVGGKGGFVSNDSGRGKAFGGDGVNRFVTVNDTSVANILISGGSYQGGKGGVAVYNNDELIDPNHLDDNFFENIDGARGGNGLRVSSEYNWFNEILTGSIEIKEGVYSGGDGGTAINSGVGPVVASGGHGVLVDYTDVFIYGGEFSGGIGGLENGNKGADGYGIRTRDSNLTITNGTFVNQSVWFESHYRDGAVEISGGTFGDAVFMATFNEFYSKDSVNTVNISKGSFGNVLFNGSAANHVAITSGDFSGIELGGDAKNTVDITGASVGVLKGSGSNAVNVATVSGSAVDSVEFSGTSDNKFTVSGAGISSVLIAGGNSNVLAVVDNGATIEKIEQYAGISDISFNTAHLIDKIVVSNGTMNISGADMSIISDNSYQLIAMDSRLNIANQLTVKDRGTLNVGLGQVITSDFTTESGAQLITKYNGTTNGVINGQAMTFGAGTVWTIEAGANTATEGQALRLAMGTAVDASALTYEDILFSSENGNWLEGIVALDATATYLDAIYGTQTNLYLALGIDPAGGSEMAKVIEDLNPQLDEDQFDLLNEAFGSQAEAQAGMGNAYVRTPEMANALIGLQSVFAGQIKDRTRSYLRQEGWGGNGSGAPQGASGPADWYDDSVEWMGEHLPTWDARSAAREVSDNAPIPQSEGDITEPGKPYVASSASTKKNYDIRLPATYQVWGRGYGSVTEQDVTDGFSGYKATVAGGILGVDKRFNNLLVGLGGGYAHTMLSGNAGNDATANTGHGVAYLAAHGETIYFDANVNYAFNRVETEGSDTFGYAGEYNAHSVGLYLGGGFGIQLSDTVLFTPEASLLNTFYSRGEYTETSSMGFSDKDWDSYDQWSHLSSLGATLSMVKHLESFRREMEFQPEIRVHWMHEFNAEMDAPTYIMPGGVNIINVALQAREEDLIRVGTGVRFSKWQSNTTEFGLDFDGVMGQDYTALIVSGKIMHRF